MVRLIKKVNRLNKNENYYIKEGKQVGDLYHVCTLDAFVNHIIEDKNYNNGEGSEDNLHSSGKYHNDLLDTKDIVSFTRDSSFIVPTDTILNSSLIFQIVVDGDSLSNRHKVTPYQDIKYTNGDSRLSEKEEVVLGAIPNFKSYIKEVYFDIKNLEELKNEDEDDIVSDIRKVIRYLNPIKCKRKYLPFDLDGYKKTLKQTFKINTLQELIAYIKNDYEPTIGDADTDELKEQFFDEDFDWWLSFELSDEEKLKKLEELLNEKSTVLTKNTKKFVTLLFQKSISKIFAFSFKTIKFLLEHGANVNSKNNAGSTALYTACYVGDIELVKLLLEHGANVNSKDKEGNTPLYGACVRNYIEVVKLLIEHGADVNIKDKYGNTPLYWTCATNHTEIAKLLIEYGANVNIKGEEGRTPLYWACKRNNTELVKLLIEHGADVNVKDEDGNTPLIWAGYHNNTEVAKLLIEHGADVNVKDGNTPLIWACYYNNTELVKLLIEHGAGKDLDADNLPEYITRNKEIEDLVLSYLNRNKNKNESIRVRRLYRL